MLKGREVFRALRYPDYLWFWSSYFISNVGAWMHAVAQGWLVFDLTDSPFYLGLFSLLRTVLLLFFFLAGGVMADRWDRRLIMIWIQIVSLASALVLALLLSFDAIRVWHIFVFGTITATVWAFEQPVRHSLIPQLVSREDLVNALALNSITWHGAGLLGPALVGLLVDSVGIGGCFYINVVTYFAVIAAMLRIRIPRSQPGGEPMRMGESLFDGIGYIRRQGLIFTLLVTSALFSIFGRSYIILLPVFAKAVLNIGASGLGFIAAAPGLGTIIGSLGVAALGRSQVKRRTMVMSLFGAALALFLFAASGSFATACLTLVAVGMLSMTFDTLLNALIQLNVTDAYRGRVMGVYGLTAAGLREFGGMQAGFLAEWTGAPFAIEAGAVVVALVAVFFLGPRLKKLPGS